MDPTSAHLPVCVHCGTPRPADESQCPECGKPWIDTVVAAVAAAHTTAVHATPAVPAALQTQPGTSKPPVSDDAEPFDDTSEFFTAEMWEEPPPEPRRWIAWLVGAVVLLLAVGAWAYVFLDSDPSAAPAASPTTSAASPVTTVAAAAAASPTSTEAPTTSAAPTTTTTPAPVYPSPSDWPAAGSAIPIGELELKAAGVGPLSLGSPIGEVASALTATFGTADAAGDEGSCPAETYWLRWGGFTVYFDGYAPDASLVAYRLDGPQGDPALQTLSGLSVGDTLDDLESTYGSYTVAYEVIDSHDHFRLSSGGSLLLWGPVSGTEADAIVEGIYSPGPCDGTG